MSQVGQLHNQRLRFRPFERADVALYLSWMQSGEVLGPYIAPEHKGLDELLADFDLDGWQSNRMRRWLLLGENAEIMGFAHCWEFDPYENHVEFGRILLPQFRGKKLGIPFLILLLNYVFSETTAHRAQSITACANIAVQRNWNTVGITTEARLREYMRLNDEYVDCFLGSILRSEWPR